MSAKQPKAPPPHLYEMARNLNLERRLFPRVKLPLMENIDFSGPFVEWEGKSFAILDLSEGGLCLHDPKDQFEIPMGREGVAHFIGDQRLQVTMRVVGSNLKKRHIQFKDPSPDLQTEARSWVSLGLRGQWLKPSEECNSSERLAAPFIWASLYNDALFRSQDPRWSYVFSFADQLYCLDKKYWPVDQESLKPISERNFDQILVALENLTFQTALGEEIKGFLKDLRRSRNG